MAGDVDPLDGHQAAQIVEELLAKGVIREPVRLLRSGSNHVFRAGDAVLRISGPERDVASQILLAERLAEAGVPTIRPLVDLGLVRQGRASLWEFIDTDPGSRLDFAGLGRAIARLHAMPAEHLADVVALPWYHEAAWLQLEPNLRRAAATGVLSREEIGTLTQVIEELDGWEQPDPDEPIVVCHGDVHPHNVLMRHGQPVVIDWDLICLGPRAWDHAALITWPERWGGHPHDYSEFAAGYGADLSADPRARRLARVRLVGPTINMVILGATSERHLAEARLRMRYWAGDPHPPQWTPQ